LYKTHLCDSSGITSAVLQNFAAKGYARYHAPPPVAGNPLGLIPLVAGNKRSTVNTRKTGIARIAWSMLFTFLIFSSCSTLQAGIYLIFADRDKGKVILANEPNVKTILEDIIGSFDNYTMKAFSRTGINFRIKQTELLTHSFYVIVFNNGEYHTLSFYGTEIASYSEGAWAYDTDSDLSSYRMYLEGDNKWNVKELFQGGTIDTRETLRNIINKIGSGTTYFYKDHIFNKPNMNNCNTALYETVALEQAKSGEAVATLLLSFCSGSLPAVSRKVPGFEYCSNSPY
jgi:hypothetical protein